MALICKKKHNIVGFMIFSSCCVSYILNMLKMYAAKKIHLAWGRATLVAHSKKVYLEPIQILTRKLRILPVLISSNPDWCKHRTR